MNLHEYQAKGLFAEFGIPVPRGQVAASVAEAERAARSLGGEQWVVKAQVHVGGRGKAGGVKCVNGLTELGEAVDSLLGRDLFTRQGEGDGQPINQILVEESCAIVRELYLGVVVDRSRRRVVCMASSAGGMEIEEMASTHPEAICSVVVDPVVGLQPYQVRRIAFAFELDDGQLKELMTIMMGLCRLFRESDASLVEINPLVVTHEGHLLALDAKVAIDENALYRQPRIAALRDPTQEDGREYHARQHGLNYVRLDGTIGCMVNGAGLAMATMDMVKLEGGAPANFLDVGGGTTAGKVSEALKIILSDEKVRAILVNIFGGIVRCDLIAEGIIKAVHEVGVTVPVVVRLEGTNVERGRALLAKSGLAITTTDDLTDAVSKAVSAAGGA